MFFSEQKIHGPFFRFRAMMLTLRFPEINHPFSEQRRVKVQALMSRGADKWVITYTYIWGILGL